MNNTKPRSNLILKVLALCIVALYILASCDFSGLNKESADGTSFYAQNMETDKFYELKAARLVEGEKCVIWAETGSGVSQNDARKIANEYDTVIRPRIVDAFSERNFKVTYNGNQYHFNDILDYANWYTNRDDGKLTILLLDIRDGFKNPQTDSYVAGYFFNGDFLPKGGIGNGYFSNGRDMIYIDTYPGLRMKQEETYATFAHELQHLISFMTAVRNNRNSPLDIWVDEGLSSQAEYLYLGKNSESKCEWFRNDKNGTIARGNNFFMWGNREKEALTILDDYATVYLFFRWLYLQANAELQPRLFRDIIASNRSDYRAVTTVAKQINPAWENWETLLSAWFAANYAPSNAVYGYKGDSYLQKTIKVTPVAGKSITLYPGEGAYSIINNPVSTDKDQPGSIRYAGLAANGTITATSSPYSGNMLLTFNANTNNNKNTSAITGQLTGVTPPVSASIGAANGGAASGGAANGGARTVESLGPHVIDAKDLLGREKTLSPASLQPLR